MDHKDKGDSKGFLDHKDERESKEYQVLLDQEMVEWSTQGGGKVPVQMSQVPHWCMQGWWNMVCT